MPLLKVKGFNAPVEINRRLQIQLDEMKQDDSIPDDKTLTIPGVGTVKKSDIGPIVEGGGPVTRADNPEFQRVIDMYKAQKQKFMNLSPKDKAEQCVSSFKFVVLTQFKHEATPKGMDAFVERATKWFEDDKNKGRMFPDPVVYLGKSAEDAHPVMVKAWGNDIYEQKYYK